MVGRNEKTRKTLVGDAREVVATCVALSVRAAERRITGFLDKRLGGTGLSAAQFALMVHVAAASDDTITALAARLGLDQSTLSRSLRALERAGLVEIAMLETDLRRRAVWLTETGAKRLEAAMIVWREAQRDLSKSVSVPQVRTLAKASETIGEEREEKP